LNTRPEYRHGKRKNDSRMTNEYIDNANPEEAEEQRKKRLDKRNKGRPGEQDDTS